MVSEVLILRAVVGIGVVAALGFGVKAVYDSGYEKAATACQTRINKLQEESNKKVEEARKRGEEAGKNLASQTELTRQTTNTYREKIIETYRDRPDSVCLPLDRVQSVAEAQASVFGASAATTGGDSAKVPASNSSESSASFASVRR